LRVATLSSNDVGVSLGLFVGVGSRHETRVNAGSTHFLKFAAFESTQSTPGYQKIRDLETNGATFTATAGREHLSFVSEVPANHVDSVVPLITDLLHPRLPYHEVAASKDVVKHDAHRIESDPVASILELVHRQAYRNKGLGQPSVAREDAIHHINQDTLAKFVDAHYNPEQAVFVGVGLDHEALVKSVQAAVGSKAEGSSKKGSTNTENTKYVGGETLLPAGGNTHVAIAFEGASIKDTKDSHVLGVLQHILGSVLSGPNVGASLGSGITSRLATNVLPSNQSAYTLAAFNFSYSDSGLFGVYGETKDAPARLVQSLTTEIGKLSNIGAEELAKGKALYKLSVLDQGTKRTPALEFIGTQVLASGKALTPEEYAAQIDSITAEDVSRVAKKVLSSRPTLVVVGDVSSLPSTEELKASFSK